MVSQFDASAQPVRRSEINKSLGRKTHKMSKLFNLPLKCHPSLDRTNKHSHEYFTNLRAKLEK